MHFGIRGTDYVAAVVLGLGCWAQPAWATPESQFAQLSAPGTASSPSTAFQGKPAAGYTAAMKQQLWAVQRRLQQGYVQLKTALPRHPLLQKMAVGVVLVSAVSLGAHWATGSPYLSVLFGATSGVAVGAYLRAFLDPLIGHLGQVPFQPNVHDADYACRQHIASQAAERLSLLYRLQQALWPSHVLYAKEDEAKQLLVLQQAFTEATHALDAHDPKRAARWLGWASSVGAQYYPESDAAPYQKLGELLEFDQRDEATHRTVWDEATRYIHRSRTLSPEAKPLALQVLAQALTVPAAADGVRQ